MKFEFWLDTHPRASFWLLVSLVLLVPITAYLTRSAWIVDPCQPSREIKYQCMPGGSLNPVHTKQ